MQYEQRCEQAFAPVVDREGALTTVDADKFCAVDIRPHHGDTWGGWTLDRTRLVLTYKASRTEDNCIYGRYELDLERMYTSAAILDWIFQVDGHGYDTKNLAALNDILHPQSTFCSFCIG